MREQQKINNFWVRNTTWKQKTTTKKKKVYLC